MEKVRPIIAIRDQVAIIKLRDEKIMKEISEAKRIKSDHLSEYYQNEQNLINELRKSNEILEKEKIDFENELKAFNSGIDIESVIKKSFTHMNEVTFDFYKREITDLLNSDKWVLCTIRLSHRMLSRGDFVGDPYLFINTKLSDLDHNTLHKLLQSKIKLNIGSSISVFNLATNIFLAKLCNKEIYEDDVCNNTKIPLMIMHNSDGDMINVVGLQYHTVEIEIDNVHTEISDTLGELQLAVKMYYYSGVYDFREASVIFGKYIGGDITTDDKITKLKKRDAAEFEFKNTYITSKDHMLKDNNPIKIPPSTKFITFRLIPKENNDLININPNIIEVTIITESGTSISFSDILSTSFLNVTIFIIPLTRESLNWNSIKESVKKCKFENTFCEFNQINVKIVTDIPYDDYDVLMSFIGFNYAICTGGMMGLVKYDKKDCDSDDYTNDV